MVANAETINMSTPRQRIESHARVRYRAPFALRCGALLIDYIALVLIMTFSTMVARLMGGGARLAGGTAEKVGIVLTIIAAILDLGVLAGLTGRSLGKWITGLRLETISGRAPGIPRALLRHFVGYPLSLLPLGLGFLVAIFNPTGRALHDLISGTVVIRKGTTQVVRPAAKTN
jgi:uncharacterized RDD family membrane protein YckC